MAAISARSSGDLGAEQRRSSDSPDDRARFDPVERHP
jgi:hypothetical protein